MNHLQHIWEQLRKGDQEALGSLFHLYYGDLLRYGQQFFKDTNVVEDKIQEVFLKLWEKQDRLPNTDNILAFLIRSLRNALIDEGRKLQSRQKLMNHLEWLTAYANEGEEEKSIQKLKQLQEALNQLSEVQQEIIFLRFYNQLPYQEIAEVVGMQYQSVRNSAHRAMKILRKVMEK